MKLFKTLLAAAALFGAGSGAALAQSNDTTFQVTITIVEACQIEATDIDFGTVGFGAAAPDATGTLTVTCSDGMDYTIGLDGGQNPIATATPLAPVAGDRRMTLGDDENFVPYDLYQPPSGTTFWGNTDGSWYSGEGTGVPDPITVTARINAAGATNVPAGEYSDTVTATITF